MAREKPHINIVFIGHVDHGKSTTVGRLLFDSGNIDEQQMRKLKEKAEELGKGGFEFAFVMDNLKEEFHHTWRKLKHARAEHEGEWQGFFDRYASAAQSLRSKVESEVIRKLPRRTTDANWNNRVNGIKAQLTAIKNQSLPILNELKKV